MLSVPVDHAVDRLVFHTLLAKGEHHPQSRFPFKTAV